MTQYARPNNDPSQTTNWTPSTGSDLWAMIDESSGGNFLGEWDTVTDQDGSAEEFTVELSSVNTPDTGTRTVTVYATEDSMADTVDLTITLKEGGVEKGTASFSSLGNDDTDPTECSFNVTSSISDYSALTLTFAATDTMGMGTSTKVFDAYLATPDAPASTGTKIKPNRRFNLFNGVEGFDAFTTTYNF